MGFARPNASASKLENPSRSSSSSSSLLRRKNGRDGGDDDQNDLVTTMISEEHYEHYCGLNSKALPICLPLESDEDNNSTLSTTESSGNLNSEDLDTSDDCSGFDDEGEIDIQNQEDSSSGDDGSDDEVYFGGILDVNKVFTKYCPKYNSFSIEEEIKRLLRQIVLAEDNMLRKQQLHGKFIVRVDGTKFDLASACRLIHNTLVLNDINTQSRNHVLDMISEIIGFALPKYHYNQQQEGGLTSFIYPTSTVLEFPVCENGDHVFVGDFKNDLLCANENCKLPRAGRCRIPSCKTLSETDRCEHGFDYRTSHRLVQYRPFCVHLQKALKRGLYYRLAQCGFASTDKIWDVMQLPVATEQMQTMHNVYNNLPDDIKETCIELSLLVGINYDGVKVFEKKASKFNPLLMFIINLPPFLRSQRGIGMFGLSIFDGVVGAACDDSEDFLMSKCVADELVMLLKGVVIEVIDDNGQRQKYFVQVRLIHHGYDTRAFEQIMKVRSTNAFDWCFLCGSVIGSGKGDVGNTCMVGNRGCMPICSVLRYNGQSLNCCPRGFYGNHPSHNPYGVRDETEVNRNAALAKNKIVGNAVGGLAIHTLYEARNVSVCCKDESHEKAVRHLLTKGKVFSWFHEDVLKITDVGAVFEKNLYYPHLDYRPRIQYSRRTNSSYYRKAVKFYKRQKSAKFTKKQKEHYKGVKGLYAFAKLPYADIAKHICWDPFHVMMNISSHLISLWKNERSTSQIVRHYCEVNNMHPSVFTPVNNEESDVGGLDSNNNTEVKQVEVEQKSKTTKPKKDRYIPEWVFGGTEKLMIDLAIESIQLPSGCKQDFQIRSIFKASGHLNGIAKIHILVCLVDLINFCLFYFGENYPSSYMVFYKLLSEDLCRLMSRSFTEEALDDLVLRIMETVCLFEGLFPPCESLPVNHQLVDIAAHIKTFGPITTWWTIGAERAVGEVGKHSTTGGSKNWVTAMNRSYQETDAILDSSFNIDENELATNLLSGHHIMTQPTTLTTKESTSNVVQKALDYIEYDSAENKFIAVPCRSYCTPNDELLNCVLSHYEVSMIVNFLSSEFQQLYNQHCMQPIATASGSSDDNVVNHKTSIRIYSMCSESLFFRLFVMYQVARRSNSPLIKAFLKVKEKNNFANWIQHIYSIIGHCVAHIKFIKRCSYDHSGFQILENLENGIVYWSDVQTIKKYLQNFETLQFSSWFRCFHSVKHGGIKFKGCYEVDKSAFPTFGPHNAANNDEYAEGGSGKWKDRANVNSWIFYDNSDPDLGQYNYCVGQALLYITWRFPFDVERHLKSDILCLVRTYPLDNTLSQPMFGNLKFVSLAHPVNPMSMLTVVRLEAVLASPIAFFPIVKPVQRLNKPKLYAKSKAGSSTKVSKSIMDSSITYNANDINIICCFPLKPYNRHLSCNDASRQMLRNVAATENFYCASKSCNDPCDT